MKIADNISRGTLIKCEWVEQLVGPLALYALRSFYSKMAHFLPPEHVRQVNKLEWPYLLIG